MSPAKICLELCPNFINYPMNAYATLKAIKMPKMDVLSCGIFEMRIEEGEEIMSVVSRV